MEYTAAMTRSRLLTQGSFFVSNSNADFLGKQILCKYRVKCFDIYTPKNLHSIYQTLATKNIERLLALLSGSTS